MKKIAVIGTIVVALFLASCSVPSMAPQPGTALETPRPTLPPLSASQTVVADGQLTSPYPPLALGFGVSGQVLTFTVRAGDVVQAGDLLAELDDADLLENLDAAQRAYDRAMADLEAAQLQWKRDLADAQQALAAAERSLAVARLQYSDTPLEEAQTALDLAQQAEADAERSYQEALTGWPPIPSAPFYDAWQRAIRERELAEMRLADAQDAHSVAYLEIEARQEEVTRAERALAALERGLSPAYERAVEDAERQLAEAQEALRQARLVAPWAAIVLSIDAAPGARMAAGAPVITLLDIEEGFDFVTENLSEQHVADVLPGQRAVVTLRAFAEAPLDGEVLAVVPQTDLAASADARFAVRIRLVPNDLRLLPGLTGRVEIVIAAP